MKVAFDAVTPAGKGSMHLLLDIRRATLFAVALLVFLAVVGPACLMQASEALGVPMDSHPMAPMECESEGSIPSASPCPHANPIDPVGDNLRSDTPRVEAVFVVAAPSIVVTSVTRFDSGDVTLAVAPPSHLTPLRL